MNRNKIRVLAQLVKIPVALPVTFLCFTGYFIYHSTFDIRIWLPSLGVFLLSCASSTINQIVERKYDALMERTKQRPLPSGNISLKASWAIAIILFLSGTILLMNLAVFAACLGVFAVVWYILVYTFLKRVTPFATIPGALTGALPLLIGYVAAGGNVFDFQIMLITAFIFIWQIPHFWLLMLVYGKEYESAGFPTLYRVFSERILKLWITAWILTLIVSSFMLISFGIIHSLSGVYVLFILGFLVLCLSVYFLQVQSAGRKHKFLFHVLNAYMIGVIIMVFIAG